MKVISEYYLDGLIELLSRRSTTDLITQSDTRYVSARLIYNRMHDCYPGLIVRTMDIDDLRTIISYAFTHDIVLAIRGGGHHIGGFGSCENGIVIDFSPFKDIHIDEDKKIAFVAPGVCLGDLDCVLSHSGYVVPTGTVSETGIAGLTLGGGIGWLIGKYGLTCDQLCGADVLLADGRFVRAEDPEHEDLLWALRGGGGNFGIVTQFRYTLNKLPKTICGVGLVSWENIPKVMVLLIKYLEESCPSTITMAPVFTKDKFGNPILRIDFCCADGIESDVIQLISLSKWIEWSDVREWQFSAWQKAFDQSFLPPIRGYWKAAYLEVLTPTIINSLCKSFEKSPLSKCSILIEQLHGVFKDYDQRSSAFPLRHSNYGILFTARWEKSEEDQVNINWVRQSFNAIDPQDLSGTYLNYTSADDLRAVQTLLSNTKITRVKSCYDPNNNFKRNHNILPNTIANISDDLIEIGNE